MTTEAKKQERTEIEPTGGWAQYNLAKVVLTLFPIFMLLCGFALLYAWPHVKTSRAGTEVVSPTSHEPYHLSLKAPSAQPVGEAPLAYGPPYPQR
jgi:hypothetical protein